MDSVGTVGLVGIGNMGSAMGRSLLDEGFDVVGFDLRPERQSLLQAAGGRSAASPADVLRHADRVVLSLPGSSALARVVSGESGLLEHARSGVVLAETSTLAIEDKVRASEQLADAGMTLLDCPISGTGAQARDRDIVFYASGPQRAFQRFEPVLLAMGRAAPWVGDFGAGSKMKFVSNLLVAVHTLAAAEALNLASHSGLDPATTHELLVAGAGTSRMLEVRGPMMIAGDFPGDSATVRVLGKDVELIRDFADRSDVPTPLLSMVSSFFTSARGQGLADADPAALAAVLSSLSPPLCDEQPSTPDEGAR